MPPVGILIVIALVVVLMVILMGLFIQRSFTTKRSHLFGSTFKDAPKVGMAIGTNPMGFSSLHIQPIVQDENQMSFSTNEYSEYSADKGLSSITSRWSSQDKGSEHSDDESSAGLIWKLWFKVEYNPHIEGLEVTVFRAKCTPERYLDQIKTSVTVCVYLLPDDVSKQTAQYANNGSPSFDETFAFLVSPSNFATKLLRLSLYELDINRTRICLGHTVIRIGDHLSSNGGMVYLYKDLEQLSVALEEPMPEIHISLMYNMQKEKMKIQIFAARNLSETPREIKTFMGFEL